MKISKEVQVGFIGFIIFVTVLFVFNYLKRKNVFSRNLLITVEFKDLDYIKKGELVLIKGREVGTIVDIYKEGERLLVDLDIIPETKIPKTAKAVISELSLMGGRAISIVYDTTCQNDCLESGAEIQGTVYTLKEQVAEGATPILQSIGNLADTIAGENGINQLLQNAYGSLHRLQKTTASTNQQLRRQTRTLPHTIKGFRELTTNLLKANSEQASSDGAAALIHQLSSLDQAAIDSMTQLLYTAREKVQNVPKQLQTVKTNIAKAEELLETYEKKILPYQEGQQGTLPKLLYNEAFRDSTQQSVKDMSNQLKDIRERPNEYLKL